MNDVGAAVGMGLLQGLGGAPARLTDQHHGLAGGKLGGVEARQGMVLRMGNMARRIFMGLAHINHMAGLGETGLLKGVVFEGGNARFARQTG